MGVRDLAQRLMSLMRARDRYDLDDLRRVHEERTWQPGDPDIAEGVPALVICGRCRAEFDSRLRACPRCGAGA